MWITKLELRNIKSHTDSGVIPFAQGVNAISGPNGAGKSTLLEAIGFALFDSLPYTQTQFLREGEKNGEVAVSFVDVLDEREYQVVRSVGSSSIYIFDPETQLKVVTGKADVVAWLKEHLGVDKSADLTALFEDSIGVPQGLLTAVFMERPATRKTKFDPLLQVDEYEEAWLRLREVVRALNDQIEAQRQITAELTGELKRLPDLEQDRSALDAEIDAKQSVQLTLQSELNALKQEQVTLDAKQIELHDMERTLETLKSRLQLLSAQREDAQSALTESEGASELVESALPGYELYVEAEKELDRLEKQRADRDKKEKEKLDLEKRVALSKQRLDDINSSLDETDTIEEQIRQIEPLVAQQNQLSDESNALQKGIAELEAHFSILSNEENKLNSLQAELAEMKSAIVKAERLESQLEEASKELKQLELKIARLQTKRASNHTAIENTRQRRTTLEESTDADCPVCHQPLDTAHREQLLREYEQQLDEFNARAKTIEDELRSTQQSLSSLQQEMDRLTAALGELPDARQLSSLESKIQSIEDDLQVQRKQVAELPQIQSKLAEIDRALADLNDPKTKSSLLNAKLQSRQELLVEQQEQLKLFQELSNELRGMEQELETYKSLDEQITTHKQQRRNNQDAHRSYLANASLAKQVEERRERLNDLENALQSAQQEIDKEKAAFEKLQRDFNEKRHAQVRTEVINTSNELARLETIIQESDKRLEQLSNDIASLQEKQELLSDTQAELESNESTAEALEFIRTAIRNAGPFVTRALVQTISLEANRIFGEIINDHTLRLIWNEDYNITIEQAGEQRDFSQLSGGEKTAAALSVRLALLRELSQIRVAFFDEPTSNLDDQRRENLASQITKITGFNQLFVISHDDTFERETHHVIHVEKSHGASQVEVG